MLESICLPYSRKTWGLYKKKCYRNRHEPLGYANESNSMRKKGKHVNCILACSLLNLHLQNVLVYESYSMIRVTFVSTVFFCFFLLYSFEIYFMCWKYLIMFFFFINIQNLKFYYLKKVSLKCRYVKCFASFDFNCTFILNILLKIFMGWCFNHDIFSLKCLNLVFNYIYI